MFSKKTGLFLALMMLLTIFLVACQPETVEVVKEVPVEVTRVVTETITEEGESVEVTRVVTEQVIVTATPEPVAPVSYTDPSPETYVHITFGDVDTLDPALAYDTSSGQVLENVMEGLIYYNYKDGTTYVPQLAVEVPSLENGGISEDGLTYTFKIREGVTFHEGGTLTPSDVAYSFQRGLLQSDPNGPQWLLLEPILGYAATHDVTEEIAEGAYAGDPEGLLTNASPEELLAVCEKVKAAVVADDAAGTVTFNNVLAWGPFLSTLAQSWGYILDQEWAIEQGDWDGDCATWQNFYAPGAENSPLTDKVNGTGPYMLQTWIPGEEIVLVANENYWRPEGEPLWEGGPSGSPRIKTVVIRLVNEWGTRFAALQAGDAESVAVPVENRVQVDQFVGEICDWITDECEPNPDNPSGTLRKWAGLPAVDKSHIFLTFNVAPDSPYIGSGALDGQGIPSDFFSDINVRRAMHYCFDHDTFIAEAQNGEGVRTNGPIIRDMLGYNEDGPYYDFDMDQCAAELELAWGGVLPETGFRFSSAFNTGNTTRQTASEILQANLSAINPAYQVDIVGLPWPTFLRSFRAAQIPVTTSGWVEDIHDPHNWAQPFTIGTFGGRQALPEDLKAEFGELVTAAVLASDPAEREQIYFELQQKFYDEAVSIPLSQQTGTRYEQRWVQDWFNRVGAFGHYWYAYGLDGGS
jgi:peptide/nickel transport system substrate-binding protein